MATPPPPGRFLTTMFQPVSFSIRSASRRASVSVMPPAPKATERVIGPPGFQSAAWAGAVARAARTAAEAANFINLGIEVPP